MLCRPFRSRAKAALRWWRGLGSRTIGRTLRPCRDNSAIIAVLTSHRAVPTVPIIVGPTISSITVRDSRLDVVASGSATAAKAERCAVAHDLARAPAHEGTTANVVTRRDAHPLRAL